MKASEFQIGDWVKMVRYEKVTELLNAPDSYNVTTEFVGGFHHRKEDEIEPIPLTKEIMDANLGDWKNDGLWYTWANTFTKGDHLNAVTVEFIMDQAILCVYERQSTMSHSQEPRILGMKISYVHELQHALRLIGLNELAKNFKV